jgi:hypothetical protein
MNGLEQVSLPPARPPRVAWLALAAVWAAALGGGVIGATTLARGHHDAARSPYPAHFGVADATAPKIGGRVVTSYGSIAVNQVERLVGPTGPTTAMHLRVPRGMVPVQVQLIANNIERHGIVFHRRAFTMVGPSGRYPVGWVSRIRVLRAQTTRTFLLRFVIPPAARLPRLEYRDAQTGMRTLIALGSARHLVTFNPVTHKHGLGGTP